MPLFEVAIIAKPTTEEKAEGYGDTLVWGVTPIVARDSEHAKIAAILEASQDDEVTIAHDLSAETIEVLVRPFK